MGVALEELPRSCQVTLVLDCCHSELLAFNEADPFCMRHAEEALQPPDEMYPSGAARARLLRLPSLPPLPSPPLPGRLACRIHSYAACRRGQWCAELPIEGCIQGAFTWAFIKSLIAGHLDMSVHQHSKALQRIIGDLKQNFAWLEQDPVLTLGGSATLDDRVLLPDAVSCRSALQRK